MICQTCQDERQTSLPFLYMGIYFYFGEHFNKDTPKPSLYLCNRYKMASEELDGRGLGLKKDPIKKIEKVFLNYTIF